MFGTRSFVDCPRASFHCLLAVTYISRYWACLIERAASAAKTLYVLYTICQSHSRWLEAFTAILDGSVPPVPGVLMCSLPYSRIKKKQQSTSDLHGFLIGGRRAAGVHEHSFVYIIHFEAQTRRGGGGGGRHTHLLLAIVI